MAIKQRLQQIFSCSVEKHLNSLRELQYLLSKILRVNIRGKPQLLRLCSAVKEKKKLQQLNMASQKLDRPLILWPYGSAGCPGSASSLIDGFQIGAASVSNRVCLSLGEKLGKKWPPQLCCQAESAQVDSNSLSFCEIAFGIDDKKRDESALFDFLFLTGFN